MARATTQRWLQQQLSWLANAGATPSSTWTPVPIPIPTIMWTHPRLTSFAVRCAKALFPDKSQPPFGSRRFCEEVLEVAKPADCGQGPARVLTITFGWDETRQPHSVATARLEMPPADAPDPAADVGEISISDGLWRGCTLFNLSKLGCNLG